jgi:hypothetical protein
MAANRPDFINPNTGARRSSVVALIPFDVIVIGCAFLLVVVVAAFLFHIGTPRGWGISPTFSAPDSSAQPAVDFWDCLHFSIVTIATLGYGDYRPVSWGRVVAALEVVLGLVLMGTLIARLVSRQQDRLLRRLVRGHLNAEIQDFRDQIAELLDNREKGSDTPPLPDRADGLTRAIARYWRHESAGRDFYRVVQTKAVNRLLGDLAELLEAVNETVIDESADTVQEVTRTHLRNVTESTLAVARAVHDGCSDDALHASCNRLYEQVIKVREKFRLKQTQIKRARA